MKRLVYAALISITASPVFADNAFTYQGKPIHPACVAALVDTSSNEAPDVALSACMKASTTVYHEEGYLTTRNEKDETQQEFSRYTIIGNQADKFLIDTGSWTGGSGFFTSVIWVEKKNDKLHLLNALAGGDRCNGGAHKAGAWEYAINDTPYDMLMRGAGKPLPIKAYDEIESSAASCVAESIYRFNPATATSSFIGMKLNDEPLSMDDYIKDIKYQFCFNKIYNQWLIDKKAMLNQTDINTFKNEFAKKCMQS